VLEDAAVVADDRDEPMATPKPATTKSAESREWSAVEAQVLAFCEAELPKQGVKFSRLHVLHSTRPVYDALVEVWQDRRAYTVGVRLPVEIPAAA
jgi:hypothetical protein